MNTKPVVRITQALVTLVFVLGVAWTPNTNARADWPFPIFMLNVNNDSSWRGLDAWNWPLGSQVTLTVDNPNTTNNPDYTEVQTMGEPNPGQTTISHALYMQDVSAQFWIDQKHKEVASQMWHKHHQNRELTICIAGRIRPER